MLQQLAVDDQEGLEPGEPWRQLEQRRGELPDGESQHERTDEPHEQNGFRLALNSAGKEAIALRLRMEQIVSQSDQATA